MPPLCAVQPCTSIATADRPCGHLGPRKGTGPQCLDPRIPDRETLEREVAAWQRERNALGGAVNWQFTAEDARVKLKRLYPSIDA
jgi:hypothetical protein